MSCSVTGCVILSKFPEMRTLRPLRSRIIQCVYRQWSFPATRKDWKNLPHSAVARDTPNTYVSTVPK